MTAAIAIIGSGAFGTALAATVAGAGRGVHVHLHCEDAAMAREIVEKRTNERRLPGVELPAGISASANLGEAARAARLLLVAVPSPRVVDTVRALGEVIDGRHIVVHAIGAAIGTRRVTDLIRTETSVKRTGALAGPALARDLAEKHPCAVVVASPFDEVIAQARAALHVPGVLRVYDSHDLAGVELASAISGAMVIAIGLADRLDLGAGVRAVLMTRAVAEGGRILRAAGAHERTFGGLAGLGNLLVRTSSSSERSDDYQLGARGGAGRETEGARAVAALLPMVRKLGVRTPILDAVHEVVHLHKPIAEAAAHLVESSAEEE